TLPGDAARIARLGPGERGPDRDGAVGLGRVAARAGPGPPDADQDLADDRLRPLRAGIVGGHPHAVAEPCGDLAHDRPLAAVAVAAAAEDDAEPPTRELPGRGQHALKGVRGVGVVD